jgi:hypothetical protein
MPTYFGRVARLQIQVPGQLGQEIDGLRVRLRSRRSGKGFDGAQIDVWGLSTDSYGQLGRGDTITRLVAGYQDGPGEVMQGQVVPLSLRRVVSEGEVVTSWQVQEATTALASVTLATSWPGAVKASEVLSYIAGALGLSLPAQALPVDLVYARGFTAYGRARQVLTTLATDCGCTWSVQAGRLVLLPLSGALRTRAFIFAPASGLIGYPEQVDGGRVRSTTLMQPGILPGDTYRLGGDTLAGDYVAEQVEHAGDLWGPEWYTYVTGRVAG